MSLLHFNQRLQKSVRVKYAGYCIGKKHLYTTAETRESSALVLTAEYQCPADEDNTANSLPFPSVCAMPTYCQDGQYGCSILHQLAWVPHAFAQCPKDGSVSLCSEDNNARPVSGLGCMSFFSFFAP